MSKNTPNQPDGGKNGPRLSQRFLGNVGSLRDKIKGATAPKPMELDPALRNLAALGGYTPKQETAAQRSTPPNNQNANPRATEDTSNNEVYSDDVSAKLFDAIEKHPRGNNAVRTVAMLINLLREEHRSGESSLMHRIGFDPKTAEKYLQCVFMESADTVAGRVDEGARLTEEMLMTDAMGIENLQDASVEHIQGRLDRLVRNLGPFQKLLRYTHTRQVSELAVYLTEQNETLDGMDQELQANTNLIHEISQEISGIETKIQDIESGQEEGDVEALDSKLDTLESKKRAFLAYAGLKLNTQHAPISLDDEPLERRLERLKLKKREVPHDYPWTEVKKGGTGGQIAAIESLRKVLTRDQEKADQATKALKNLDVSFARTFFEDDRPIEELILIEFEDIPLNEGSGETFKKRTLEVYQVLSTILQ